MLKSNNTYHIVCRSKQQFRLFRDTWWRGCCNSDAAVECCQSAAFHALTRDFRMTRSLVYFCNHWSREWGWYSTFTTSKPRNILYDNHIMFTTIIISAYSCINSRRIYIGSYILFPNQLAEYTDHILFLRESKISCADYIFFKGK